ADVDVDGFAFEVGHVDRAGVSQHEVADVDIGADACVRTLVDKARHGRYAIKQTEPERLQLKSDVDFLLVSVIAEDTTGLDCPTPLVGRRNDLSLPDVFAEHEENVFRTPFCGKVDEGFAALHVKGAHGFIEVDQAGGNDGKRNDGQVAFPTGLQ